VDVDRLLDGLDADQRAAVTEPTHPLAILAGAGSGKTRVLTHRIAHRCLTGDADPRHVLAVTFTRKAAAELDRRLRRFGLRDLPAAGTFHALALAQLRAGAAPAAAPPVLLERKGRLLGRILGGGGRFGAADLAAEIEWAKARLVSPERYPLAAQQADRRLPVPPERVADWYRRYEQEKRKRGVVDFDDLLLLAIRAIDDDPTAAAAVRWRHRHLFVDEYQDINPLQERLLRAWLGDRRDLCVVGDANQAIYGWNGADPDLLERFALHHPGAAVVELRSNYRSTPQILRVATAVLRLGGSPARLPHAHRPGGPVPAVTGYRSDLDEANGIARAVRDHHRPGRSWSAQAVLVRTNAQTAVVEAALRRAAIPHRVRGGHRFLQDPEIRDLLDRLRRLREPLATTVEDLTASLVRQRREVLEAHYGDLDALDGPPEALTLPDTAVARRLDGFEQVVRLAHDLLSVEPGARSDAFGDWLRTVLRDDDPDAGDAVTIASFHAAKGLEWEVVHVAGVEAGYVPITHARTPAARAEEVRLFYVACTRAAEVLRCSWAASRTFGDRTVERQPSPFLDAVRSTVAALDVDHRPADAPTSVIEASRAALAAATAPTAPGGRDGRDGRDRQAERAQQAARDRVEAALAAWRRRRAREVGVRPTVVLGDRALRAVAAELPRTPEDLERVAGLGPVLRSRHGARLLAIVAEALDSADPSTDPVEEDPCGSR